MNLNKHSYPYLDNLVTSGVTYIVTPFRQESAMRLTPCEPKQSTLRFVAERFLKIFL